MLTDIKQHELDIAEERLLTALFGSTTPDAKTQWLLKFLNIDLNELIQNFEFVVKPLMNEQGLVDGVLTRSLVATQYPVLSNIIPAEPFRLVDIADSIGKVLERLMKGIR